MPQNLAIDVSEHLGTLAVRLPAAARVLAKHHLDFCCGGARSLKSACEKAHLDVDAVANEIRALASFAIADIDVQSAPLPEVIDHILKVHHVPLREEFVRLHDLAFALVRAHGDEDERHGQVLDQLDELIDELLEHMQKEEQVLFPWIRSGKGHLAGGPISVMHMEHERCGEQLAALQRLTDMFTPPTGACTKHRALFAGLAALDTDLRLHMHKENTALFPRALADG